MEEQIFYRYHHKTKEYLCIEIDERGAVSISSCTKIKPTETKEGFAICFNKEEQNWEFIEDNRGKTVYDIETKQSLNVDYLGAIKENFTTLEPFSYCVWDSKKNIWIEDTQAKNEAEELVKYNEAKQYLQISYAEYFEELQDGTAPAEVIEKRKEAKQIVKNYKK